MYKKIFLKTLIILALVMFFGSCQYEFIEVTPPIPNDSTNVGDSVSFKDEIVPIFENSSCLNCHDGGLTLDLRENEAYQSIIDHDKAIPFDPENSPIYTVPHPVTGNHTQKYSSVEEANLIYNWIDQGAEDN